MHGRRPFDERGAVMTGWTPPGARVMGNNVELCLLVALVFIVVAVVRHVGRGVLQAQQLVRVGGHGSISGRKKS